MIKYNLGGELIMYENLTINDISFKSTNNNNKVYAKIIVPQTSEIRGIMQISHGMCEYFDKYHEFTEFLVSKGFVVCGHDHLGHGNSINSPEELGFFGVNNGYKYLIEDTKKVTDITKKYINELVNKDTTQSAKKEIPYILFGHSMGSLIARCYSAKYGSELSGLILCGTVRPTATY